MGTRRTVRLIRSPNLKIRSTDVIWFSFPARSSTIGSPLNSNSDPNHDQSFIHDHDEICSPSSTTVESWHNDPPPAGNLDPELARFIEPLDSRVREMARPSSILAALQAEKLVKTCDFAGTSMLKGLRIVGQIPGGLDRPQPSRPSRDQGEESMDTCQIETTRRSTTSRAWMILRSVSKK